MAFVNAHVAYGMINFSENKYVSRLQTDCSTEVIRFIDHLHMCDQFRQLLLHRYVGAQTVSSTALRSQGKRRKAKMFTCLFKNCGYRTDCDLHLNFL